jgi:hypothetical protein
LSLPKNSGTRTTRFGISAHTRITTEISRVTSTCANLFLTRFFLTDPNITRTNQINGVRILMPLKIRVSVVRFRPWPPFKSQQPVSCIQSAQLAATAQAFCRLSHLISTAAPCLRSFGKLGDA